MALSGSISGNYRGYTLTTTWSATQSVAENYSYITCNHTLYCPYALYIGNRNNSCTVDGTSSGFTSGGISTSGGTTHNLGTTYYKVYHNNDGTKSCNISTNFKLQATMSGIYVEDINANGTITLDTIPRKATITSAPDFNDEQNPTIYYENKAGNSVSSLYLRIEDGNNNILVGDKSISKTGTSYTFNFTEEERNALRNSTTNSNTRNVLFVIKTVIGSNTYWNVVTKQLSIVNANPILGTLTYKDSNSVTTAITENNQRIIRNNSNLLFTIGSATAKKGATISKYEIKFNNSTKSRTSAGDLNFGTINLSNNSNATLKVTDSRGNNATKNVTVIIDDWLLPTALISLKRKNNFYSETYLKVDASYSSLNGKNLIGIQYQYKKVSDKNFSAFYNLENNVQSTINLDNNYQWNISVVITDKIGQTTYNLVLDRGMPIIFFDRKKNSVGINCFPIKENSVEENGKQLFGHESGNWTPRISALNETAPTITYLYQEGSYKKIGKFVYINFYLRGTITKLNGTNNYACITGLPFTPLDYKGGKCALSIGIVYGLLDLADSNESLTMFINGGVIRIQRYNGSTATQLKANSSGYFEVAGSGWYEVS